MSRAPFWEMEADTVPTRVGGRRRPRAVIANAAQGPRTRARRGQRTPGNAREELWLLLWFLKTWVGGGEAERCPSQQIHPVVCALWEALSQDEWQQEWHLAQLARPWHGLCLSAGGQGALFFAGRDPSAYRAWSTARLCSLSGASLSKCSSRSSGHLRKGGGRARFPAIARSPILQDDRWTKLPSGWRLSLSWLRGVTLTLKKVGDHW